MLSRRMPINPSSLDYDRRVALCPSHSAADVASEMAKICGCGGVADWEELRGAEALCSYGVGVFVADRMAEIWGCSGVMGGSCFSGKAPFRLRQGATARQATAALGHEIFATQGSRGWSAFADHDTVVGMRGLR